MNFMDKAIRLREDGYVHFYDRDRQRTAGICSRCNKSYTVESFVRGGDYKHYSVCVFCGSWSSLDDDDNEFFYSPIPTANARDQEKKDAARMFHYTHGLRLSSSYTDFKCFILAYTVCEIRANNGGKRTKVLDYLEPKDVKKIATCPTDANVDNFFRRFYRSLPASRDKDKLRNSLIRAAKRDFLVLEFLESQGVNDIEKWFQDVKYSMAKPAKRLELQISLFEDL